MISRAASSWQVTLADLSLILFLVTLTGLSSMQAAEVAENGAKVEPPNELPTEGLYLAQSQSLFRAEENGVSLASWLGEQSLDPRATLSIFVTYPSGEQDWAARTAGEWLTDSLSSGVNTRVIMQSGDQRDAYASLGFDHHNDVEQKLAD